MKKITLLLTLLFTTFLGAMAEDFTPVTGAKYLIKCKGDNKFVLWNESCVKSKDDNTNILSNGGQFDYRSLFTIEGNATDGYYFRSVKDNTRYIYAINTDNDKDGNVGVKAVSGTPDADCKWKIVQNGDGWNIVAFAADGNGSWNNRGSYGGNAHVGTWNSNNNANNIWYIQTPEELVQSIATSTETGKINAAYTTAATTAAKTFATSSGTEADFNAFKTAYNNKASYVNLSTGYYRLKSSQTDGNGENNSVFNGTYLFTDIVNYPNVAKTLANVPLDEAKAKNNYVWKITRGELPSATVDIVNGQGKGVNNGTNYNTINLGLSDYYTTGAIYFTQGLHISNQSHLTVGGTKNASAEATRSNPFTMTGWAYTDSKGSAYIFEPVSMDGVTAYTVNVTGAEGYVTLNSTNEVAMNGGFFLLSSAPTVSDFTAKTLDGYDVTVTIAENTINVSYAHNYAYAKAEAEATIAKIGVGYPTTDAAARTTLNKAISDAAAAEPNTTTAATLLATVDAYKKNYADIQMPEDGKAYVITNIHKTGGKRYMKYQEDGTSMIVRGEGELPIEATYICHKVGDKYVFANNSGTYLTWRGNKTGDCTNNNLGFTTSYDADYNTFTVAVNPDVFGCLSFGAKRNDTRSPQSYYIVTNTGSFDKAGFTNFYTDSYSSAFTFEEVTYPNTIKFNAATGINGVNYIATFSAPFATIIPDGVKAYYVSAKDTKATMTAIDAQEAIPANQGVILTSESGVAATMVPAASETVATITANQLGNSAGVAKTLTAGEGFILGNGSEDTAFYPCNAGSLPINKAYLLGSGESAIAMNFGNAVTGINNIVAPANAKAPIFDLCGRRVVKTTKGLYIQNGKKFIVK